MTPFLREIGDVYDLSSFDYSAGKMGTSLIKPGRCRKQVKKAGKEDNEGSDLSVLVPPIRQTASIFKQPVTLYRTHQAEVKKNIRTDKEKPRQLFWEKRLSDVSPNHSDEETLFKSLPACIKGLISDEKYTLDFFAVSLFFTFFVIDNLFI